MSEDLVNHPPHYTSHPSGVECITVTEHMGFNLGNALKYIWRADLKASAEQDLRKAMWYVQREIDKRFGKAEPPAAAPRVDNDYLDRRIAGLVAAINTACANLVAGGTDLGTVQHVIRSLQDALLHAGERLPPKPSKTVK